MNDILDMHVFYFSGNDGRMDYYRYNAKDEQHARDMFEQRHPSVKIVEVVDRSCTFDVIIRLQQTTQGKQNGKQNQLPK